MDLMANRPDGRSPTARPPGARLLPLCRKLSRAGLPRAPHQGPLAYSQLIVKYRPDLSPTWVPLLEQYAILRFGHPPSQRSARISRPSSVPSPGSQSRRPATAHPYSRAAVEKDFPGA